MKYKLYKMCGMWCIANKFPEDAPGTRRLPLAACHSLEQAFETVRRIILMSETPLRRARAH